MSPQLSFLCRKREDLRAQPRARTAALKPGAPGSDLQNNDPGSDGASPMGALLRRAAANLGSADKDASAYEARLENDWISKPEQLKG